MLRVAIVDIDTSHGWVLGNYVRATGRARVSHVVDSGLCWPAAHTKRLADALGAEVCGAVDELVGKVDGVLLLGARYDNRLMRAAPLIEAGIPLFLDKPAGGTVAQIDALGALIDRGYPLLCGSSMPYCAEVERIARVVQAGAPSALAVFGCHEYFEHGIHAADIALSVVRAPLRRVSWSAFGASELLWVETDSATQIAISVEAAANWCLAANGVSGNAIAKLNVGFHRDCHYARLARAFVDLCEGKPVPLGPRWHIEAIRLLIAGAQSRETGRPVDVADLMPADGFDGLRYAEEYADKCRNSQYPQGTLAPDAEMFTVAPEYAGLPALNRRQRFRMHARDAALHVLGERGKRVVKKVLRRA